MSNETNSSTPTRLPLRVFTARAVWRSGASAPAASLALAVLVLVAWQYLPPTFGVPKYIIPRVSDLWSEMIRMWFQENLLRHFISTASMSILGFILGGLLALADMLAGARAEEAAAAAKANPTTANAAVAH